MSAEDDRFWETVDELERIILERAPIWEDQHLEGNICSVSDAAVVIAKYLHEGE